MALPGHRLVLQLYKMASSFCGMVAPWYAVANQGAGWDFGV